jgi:hypothetical protein
MTTQTNERRKMNEMLNKAITVEEIKVLAHTSGEVQDNRFFFVNPYLYDIVDYNDGIDGKDTTVVCVYFSDTFNGPESFDPARDLKDLRFAFQFETTKEAHDYVMETVKARLSTFE